MRTSPHFMIEPAKIQSSAKSIFKDIDLYGAEVLVSMLQQYSHVSHCPNSIPSSGSATRKTSDLKCGSVTNIEKLICHKDGKTTIKTDKGYLQFLNI